MNYLIIALIWTVYCVLHSYLISISFTKWMMLKLKSYYAFYRVFYILISIALLLPALHFTNEQSSNVLITYNYPLSIVRYLFMIFSLLIFIRAFFFDYDILLFFGIRQIINFRKKVIDKPGEIKKKGLLSVVRHPMYFALIIFLWCLTTRSSDIVANLVLTVYIIIGTRLEERKLIIEFGDSYTQYQKEVPMLFPFTKSRVAKI